MKRGARALLAIALAAAASVASAQYVIEKWTVDGGGGRSQGGPYAVTGTIAQFEADALHPVLGGPYALTGGYWSAGTSAPTSQRIFRNGFE